MNENPAISAGQVDALIDAPVFLLGMPRSGTTWLSQIFESSAEVLLRLSPNYSYPLKNMLDASSPASAWRAQLRAAVANIDDPFMSHNWRREKGELEWFEKEAGRLRLLVIKDTRFHDLYLRGMELFPAAKCIFIVRHPCGHLNSWWRSPEFPKKLVIHDHWRTGAGRKSEGPGEYWGFNDWKELTHRYLALERQAPKRFCVFRYEDLAADPPGVAQELFAFCGLEMGTDVGRFLQRSHASHNESVYSVFRSPDVVDKWRREFPQDIYREIERELENTELERFL